MIKPLGNRVAAKIDTPITQTKSGILLGDSQDKPAYVVVAAVGPEVKGIKVGDKIVYKEYTGTNIKVNDDEFVVIDVKDVLATI